MTTAFTCRAASGSPMIRTANIRANGSRPSSARSKMRRARPGRKGGAVMKRGRKPKPEVSPELAAMERLVDDGASSNASIRKRVALIAAERKLDPSETMAMMKGRWLRTFDLCQFAKKYHLSADWLIFGDLKGLLRTVPG